MAYPPTKVSFKRPVLSLPVPNYSNTEQEIKPKEQTDLMEKLSDSDFKHLLQQSTWLKKAEKEYLIFMLQQLLKNEPQRIEYLKQFFESSILFRFLPEPTPEKKLANDSDKRNPSTNENMTENRRTPDKLSNQYKDKIQEDLDSFKRENDEASLENYPTSEILTPSNYNSITNPSKRIKYDLGDDIPESFKETCANVEKWGNNLLRFNKYEPILEVDAAEIIKPFLSKSGVEDETNASSESLQIRKDRLRKDIKYLFDWDKITVPALSFKSLKNLIRCFNNLCINERFILIEYMLKLNMQWPDLFTVLLGYITKTKPKEFPENVLNPPVEVLNVEQTSLDSDEEYSLDDVMKTALDYVEKKDNNMNVAALLNKLQDMNTIGNKN